MPVQPVAACALQNALPRLAVVPGQTAYRVALGDDGTERVRGVGAAGYHLQQTCRAVTRFIYGFDRSSRGIRSESAHRGGPCVASVAFWF